MDLKAIAASLFLTALGTFVMKAEDFRDKEVPMPPDCKPMTWTPVGNSSGQGGYSFDFQSGSANNCRQYRLRNTPGGVKTPVRWFDRKTNDLYVEFNLPRCAAQPCGWFERTVIGTTGGLHQTTIGYGINKDEFEESAQAYHRDLELTSTNPSEFPPLWTLVRGTVVTDEEQPISVSLAVGSLAQGKTRRLTYVFHVMDDDEADYVVLLPEENASRGIRWTPAEKKEFQNVLFEQGGGRTSPKRPLVVEFDFPQGQTIRRSTDSLLEILVHDEVVLKTTAPAYIPAD